MLLESVAAAIVLTGANYADYSSTKGAVARGGIEMNPLAGPQAQRIEVVKVVEVAAEFAIFKALQKKSKPAAWTWVAAVVTYNVVIAHKNGKVLRDQR